MKNASFSKIIAVVMVAALSVAAFSGCAYRRNNNTGTPAANGNNSVAVSPRADNGANIGDRIEDRVESDIRRGTSELEEDFNINNDRDYDNDLSHPDLSRPGINEFDHSRDEVYESVPAMSADFSQIGALSGQKDTGFPGGPVDELNRPSGPISYQKKYEKYDARFIVTDSKKIYLTFDEGYENGYTSRILDILKEKNVKAVFFITYPYAKTETALVKRMIDEGHTIGNHSTKHFVYPDVPIEEAAEDLTNLHNYVLATYGYKMWLFRPPEGAFSEQTLALAQQLGYDTMLWSFAYKDYDVQNQPSTIEAQGNILKKLHPGEICLLHAVSRTNAEILGSVIDETRKRGFEFADYFYFH